MKTSDGTPMRWEIGNSHLFKYAACHVTTKFEGLNGDLLKAKQSLALLWSARSSVTNGKCVDWGLGRSNKHGNFCAQNLIKGRVDLTYRYPAPSQQFVFLSALP